MSLFTRAKSALRTLLGDAPEPATPLQGRVVRQPGVEPGFSLPAPRQLDLRLSSRESIARGTLRLTFEPGSGPDAEALFAWHPGQHATVIFEADEAAGLRRETRIYSIWNRPAEPPGIAIVIRCVPGGRATRVFESLPIGDTLPFVGPQGTFALRTPLAPRLVFAATGTGYAPIRAMLVDLEARGELARRDVIVLWGLRSQADVFAEAELSTWAARYPRLKHTLVLSQPEGAYAGPVGRITTRLAELRLSPEDTQVYLCGNGQMILDCFAILERSGLRRETGHVIFEKFFDAPLGGISGAALRP